MKTSSLRAQGVEDDQAERELERTEARALELESENARLRGEPATLPATRPSARDRERSEVPAASAYRAVEPAARIERDLQDAEERVADLAVEHAILIDSRMRERSQWMVSQVAHLVYLLPACIGLLSWWLTSNLGLGLACALFGSLGLLLYVLIGRIKR